ncbi:MAG TPA: BTAD domain-containing putative transcriptional regulator [Nitrospirota bacterium]|nr:BTAD domain-containing putative transcriptional regulator [Nitrospirota bacterium]
MFKQASIVKISRPRLQKVLPRKRLFDLLDKDHNARVTWVMGPAGSGKTTLVASWLDAKMVPCLWYQLDERDGDIATFFYYLGFAAKKAAPRIKKALPLLTREYLNSIPTFTKNYFENLCSRLKPPYAIILDNYHHIASDSPFHEMISEALLVVPEGIKVIICSRGTPPSFLGLLQTYNNINYIGWEELKFDRKETGQMLRSGQTNRLRAALLERVYSLTEGWAAGLVLMTERLRAQAVPHESDQFNRQEFFNYFATELFEKADRGTRDFLLKSSFLTRITVPAARELTGVENADALLSSLNRNHIFTEKRDLPDPVYQYHPLFREFLNARARETYSPQEMLDILQRAANLLVKDGQIEDAVELYRLSGAWEWYVRLVLTQAMSMASQGRTRSLETWLDNLPDGLLEIEPWLLYWKGMCRMPFALLESRRYFEQSFAIFRKRHDAAGVFLAWSNAVETIIQELGDLGQMDPWIALLDDLMKEYSSFPSPQIEGHVTCRIFMALSLRQPWHPEFDAWRGKAMTLLTSSVDSNLRLLSGYYLFTYFVQGGDRASCELVLDIMKSITGSNKNLSPLAHGMAKMAEAWFAWFSCSYSRCIMKMEEGLEISRESGVHLWDYLHLTMGVVASLSSGDLAQSGQLLDQMSSAPECGRSLDRFYYYHMMSCHFSHAGEIPRAISFEQMALELAEKIGFLGAQVRSRINMAHLMRVTGKNPQAKEYIAVCRRLGRKLGSELIEFFCSLSDACSAFAERKEATGLRYLHDAMTLGSRKGFAALNYAAWYPAEMSMLCVRALEAGIETNFVRDMIRKRNLVPETPPLHVDTWPWPIKIYTLGRFEIMRDGKPIQFTGKVQKKPLEMLKVLIAFGAMDISEERIADALWPDVDGDTARLSFKTTLHRLRNVLGKEEFIQLKEGRISLERRTCWVDAWAFETMVEHAEAAGREQAVGGRISARSKLNNERYVNLLEKAISMYHGHYLGNESDKPWSISFKERLRNKFLSIVAMLGDYWNQQSSNPKAAVNKAIECYQRGIEIDDVAEDFYQNLMLCYGKLGRKVEAAKVYKRCRDTLASSFGVEPSKETHAIYQSILKQ